MESMQQKQETLRKERSDVEVKQKKTKIFNKDIFLVRQFFVVTIKRKHRFYVKQRFPFYRNPYGNYPNSFELRIVSIRFEMKFKRSFIDTFKFIFLENVLICVEINNNEKISNKRFTCVSFDIDQQ